ncbi:hypothetical protein C7B77_03435 [Chamaesiphon polymorphus CCALA 037]|uniref:Uncharacterized protein n=2 Tax=Chamaesiphon TaxID=217161 RepID=A0A2T1GLK8_9CYAN|nr:hypothetical protein C7B77_03435 [Chamaesiphon polymorphus CCALA 037]
MATRLKVLTLDDPSLCVEKVQAVASEYLTAKFNTAIQIGMDADDPYSLWELLAIDGVISLEDIHGEHHRVGVSIVERENRAYRLMKRGETSHWKNVWRALGIDCYWVFCVNLKHLPSDAEWVDILYQNIDRSHGCFDYRLVNL